MFLPVSVDEFEQYGAGQAIDEDTDTQWVSEDQATAQDYFEIDLRYGNQSFAA